MQVDFGNVAKLYALYRNDLPQELLKTLKLRGVKLKGKKLVDLGAGTGVLSRALYKEGAEVIGIEPVNRRGVKDRSGKRISYYI